MDAKDVLKALGGPDIPAKPHVTVHLERGNPDDMVWLSQCVDPNFDMSLLLEGLATAIVINAKYQAVTPEEILKFAIHRLQESVAFHGTIKRKK